MKTVDNIIQNPMVSVVIPSYNRANTVSQTIESILNQKCNFDFELIIGDDCSTDNTRDILSAYQSRYPEQIKLLFYDENIGLGANWATCIKHCRGKYIANCDNDDYWHHPQKLQLQVDFMEQHLNYGLCYTNYRVHDRTTGRITECEHKHIIEKESEEEETLLQSVMNGHFTCCNASIMYRKSVLLRYVNMDDFIKYRFSMQDWNTWALLAPFTEFGFLPVSTSTFGVETSSITRPKSIKALEERWRGHKICYKYVCEQFPTDCPYNEKEFDTQVNTICLNFAYETFDFFYAKKYALRCNKSLKARFANYRISFYLIAFAGKLKRVCFS